MSSRKHLERGEVSELVIVLVVSLFLIAGLVIDGGAKLTATSIASSTAQEAARAGAQPLDALPSGGGTAHISSSQAAAAAQSYLSAAGAQGSVRIIDSTTIEVTVSSTEPTVFLGLIGIHSLTATRTARVDLIHGQTTEVTS